MGERETIPVASKDDDAEISPAVVPGYILGIIILICLIYVSYRLQEIHPERYFNMLLIPTGGSLGWVVGIYLSPRGNQQERQFQTLGKAIGTFVSGYLLAKVSPLFQHFADDKEAWNILVGTRAFIFVISFFLGLLFVFIGRTQKPLEDSARNK